MLVITRREGEEVVIGDPHHPIGIVRVVGIKGDRVRLAFEFPRDVDVHRREIALQILQAALNSQPADPASAAAASADPPTARDAASTDTPPDRAEAAGAGPPPAAAATPTPKGPIAEGGEAATPPPSISPETPPESPADHNNEEPTHPASIPFRPSADRRNGRTAGRPAEALGQPPTPGSGATADGGGSAPHNGKNRHRPSTSAPDAGAASPLATPPQARRRSRTSP